MNEITNISATEAVLSDFDGTLVETESAKGKLFHEGVAKAEAQTGLNYPQQTQSRKGRKHD